MSMNKDMTTEQAILKAAEEEFLEKGFAMAKTTEIAKRVGVNQALVHYYFRTKENLFNKVFQKKVKELADSFLTIVEQDLPFFEKIRSGMEAHFDFIAANPKLPFFILSEFLADEKRVETFKESFTPITSKLLEQLKIIVEAEVAKGTIQPIDPVHLIIDIVSVNVFGFLAHPLMRLMSASRGEDYESFMHQRKKENVLVIMTRLRCGGGGIV